jgi:hypothetical protein
MQILEEHAKNTLGKTKFKVAAEKVILAFKLRNNLSRSSLLKIPNSHKILGLTTKYF